MLGVVVVVVDVDCWIEASLAGEIFDILGSSMVIEDSNDLFLELATKEITH
jgi:hypothetical protein